MSAGIPSGVAKLVTPKVNNPKRGNGTF